METEARARFRAFFREHYESVLAYALRRVDPPGAEDVVAETFLIAWRRFEDVPPDPLPWLYGVARRVSSNHRRSYGRREAADSRFRAQTREPVLDPGELVADRAEILTALDRLPIRDREILALVAWEGLSTEAAARALGCSTGAFWVRLHRARRRLAHALDEGRGVRPGSVPLDPAMKMESS